MTCLMFPWGEFSWQPAPCTAPRAGGEDSTATLAAIRPTATAAARPILDLLFMFPLLVSSAASHRERGAPRRPTRFSASLHFPIRGRSKLRGDPTTLRH